MASVFLRGDISVLQVLVDISVLQVLSRAGKAVASLSDQLRLILRIWLKIRRQGGHVMEEGEGVARWVSTLHTFTKDCLTSL
jgi:hypothetical protein